MARTWGYTRRNRLPIRLLDAVGRVLSSGMSRVAGGPALGGNADVRRILVVEFWNIGDVVLTMPFLAQLRALFPQASIALLARHHAAEIFEGSNLVDEVIPVDLPWTATNGKYDPRRYHWPALRRVFRALRQRSFDVAFESRMDPRAKVVLALSGARRRVAYDYGDWNWLLTDVVAIDKLDRHRVDDWMRLLEPFGEPRSVACPRLTVSAAETAWVKQWLAASGARSGDQLVAVHPGASSPDKRWPLERFENVAREILTWDGARVIALQEPAGYGSELARIPGVMTLRTSLRQLLALLAEVDVLICNDSGPMHLAWAVGTPIVGVFHEHAAREFAPLGVGHHVLYGRGRRRSESEPPEPSALLEVAVDDVLAAARSVLGRHAGKRGVAS